MTAGLAIYDTMQYVLPPISTWCVGQACSMGSLLLTAGTKVHPTPALMIRPVPDKKNFFTPIRIPIGDGGG